MRSAAIDRGTLIRLSAVVRRVLRAVREKVQDLGITNENVQIDWFNVTL